LLWIFINLDDSELQYIHDKMCANLCYKFSYMLTVLNPYKTMHCLPYTPGTFKPSFYPLPNK